MQPRAERGIEDLVDERSEFGRSSVPAGRIDEMGYRPIEGRRHGRVIDGDLLVAQLSVASER